MNKRISITFSEKQIGYINNISNKTDKSFAETVRYLCDEAIKVQMSNDNIDLVVDIIEDRLRAILKPQIERLASLSAKGGIMAAASSFLNAQVIAEFIPKERRREFSEVYKSSRLKGICYFKNRTNDEEDINKSLEEDWYLKR